MKSAKFFLFGIWALVVLGLGLSLIDQFRKGMHWETNILALLPVTEKDSVVEQAVRTFTARIGQKNIFLIGHSELAVAQSAADALATKLEAAETFENLVYRTGEVGERAFFELYFPFRYVLLDERTRARLAKPNGGATLVGRAKATLYGPMTAAISGILEEDPLLLFPEFLQSFPKPPGSLEIHEGRMRVQQDGRQYFLLTADLVGSAFKAEIQAEAVAQLEVIENQIRAQHQGLDMLATGLLRYAYAGTKSAKHEISTIGLGSLLGILVLLLVTFRSPWPFLMSLLPIGVGCLTAVTLTFLWFGELHILTLVFGASLIGVCIDYSFHFFCECYLSREGRDPCRALTYILPAISLGALTSVLGYLSLLFAPFPGLKQMAVFSSLGLLGAFATVVCCFPLLARLGSPKTPGQEPFFLRWVDHYLHFWRQRRARWFFAILVAPMLLAGWHLSQLEPNDDIRLLQNQPPELVSQEMKIRDWIGGVDTSRFLLVEGANVEAMLQKAESIHLKLLQAQAKDQLSFFQGLHQWVPSNARQIENQRLLRQRLLGAENPLAAYLHEMGFEPDLFTMVSQNLNDPSPPTLTLETWLESAASVPFRHLWLGETDRGVATIVLLGGITDESTLESLAAKYPGVSYIDKVDDVSNLFARYRVLASQLVLLAYVLILLLLIIRYGVRKGLMMVVPPLLAAWFALAIVAALGIAINLFSMLALLLVLGIGIDYTIFLGESKKDVATTMMAIVLSSTTTILSFGLLALSATPVLRSFGLTLLLGISMAMFFAPLVICGSGASQPSVETHP